LVPVGVAVTLLARLKHAPDVDESETIPSDTNDCRETYDRLSALPGRNGTDKLATALEPP